MREKLSRVLLVQIRQCSHSLNKCRYVYDRFVQVITKTMCFFSVLQSAVYSTVNKTNCDDAVNEDDKEHDYSSIAEIKGLVTTSSSSDLYATVRDIYSQPSDPQPGEDLATECTDPGYESIRIPKTSSPDDDHRAELEAEGTDAAKAEPDYESVGELGLDQETSRL